MLSSFCCKTIRGIRRAGGIGFLALLLLPLSNASAATIAGKVTNQEGTAIASAEVVIRQKDSDFSQTVLTAADGSYSLPSLPAGVYTIVVKKAGYADLTQENVAVREESETVQLPFRLRSSAEQAVLRGVEELNPNLFYVKLDTNEITREINRRGADVQFHREFRAEENFFGVQYGYLLRDIEWARAGAPLRNIHGSLYEAHQSSSFNARSFFTVGNLLPWRRNDFGGQMGGPVWNQRLDFNIAASQTRDSGYINGNVQVPLASERVPLTTDPAVRPLIAGLLKAYPVEVPNLPYVSLRQLNTNAVRDIVSTAFSTRLAYRSKESGQLVLEQRFLDSTEHPFEFVAGQNPVTFLRPQSVHLGYNRPLTPQTTLRLAQNFDRLAVLLDVSDRYKKLLAPLGRNVVPEILFGRDLTRLGPGDSYPRRRVENRYHFSGDVSQARGSHRLAAGILVSRLQTNDLQSDNTRGEFSFGPNFGRTSVQNFLLGTPTQFRVSIGELYRGFRNWELAYYLQDTIRLRPDLTLSLGLRHEIVTAPSEVNNLTAIPFGTDATNLAPQFGLAWNPGGGKTVLRGGYGIQYSSIFPVLYQRARFNPPAVQVISTDNPNLLDPLRGAELRRSGLNRISPDMVTPYSHLYNFAIERELPSNVSLRVAYIGSRTIQLPVNVVTNRARPVPGIPTTTGTINQRRPDPGYLEISTISNGTIAYLDALQVTADKRLSGGLSWNLRYTFSKAINSTGTQSFANISGLGHISTIENDIIGDMKGLEQFDTPHSLTIGYRYQFPWGRGYRGLKSLFPGGWRISGTTSVRSGTPIHIHTGSDSPGFGNVDGVGGDRPNLLNPGILWRTLDHPDTSPTRLGAQTCQRPGEPGAVLPYMTCDSFDSNIAPAGRGNLGFQTFRTDGLNNWNLALEKEFLLREPVTLQFRTEFVNFLNHPQFEPFNDEMAYETYAKITNTANRGRVIQFLLRLQF